MKTVTRPQAQNAAGLSKRKNERENNNNNNNNSVSRTLIGGNNNGLQNKEKGEIEGVSQQ